MRIFDAQLSNNDYMRRLMEGQQSAVMRQRDFDVGQRGALNQAMQNNIPRPPQEKTSSTETLLLLLD